MASRGHVQTLTLAHTRKVQGVMQMRQTRQMQIDEDACIRNSTDKNATPETCNLSATTLILTTLAVCGLRKMVCLNQKSWFVRQKVMGANIHETEGLLERNIALPHAHWQ